MILFEIIGSDNVCLVNFPVRLCRRLSSWKGTEVSRCRLVVRILTDLSSILGVSASSPAGCMSQSCCRQCARLPASCVDLFEPLPDVASGSRGEIQSGRLSTLTIFHAFESMKYNRIILA